MHFLAIFLPALVTAFPQLASRAVASDTTNINYKYCFPSNFNHTGVPDTIHFDSSQFTRFSSLVPVKVARDGEVVVIGAPNITKVAHYNDTRPGEDTALAVEHATDPRCPTCIAACAILGVLGPEAIIPCVALCLTRSFCHH